MEALKLSPTSEKRSVFFFFLLSIIIIIFALGSRASFSASLMTKKEIRVFFDLRWLTRSEVINFFFLLFFFHLFYWLLFFVVLLKY